MKLNDIFLINEETKFSKQLENKIKTKMIELDIEIQKIELKKDDDDKLVFELFNKKNQYILINKFLHDLHNFKINNNLKKKIEGNYLNENFLKDPKYIINSILNNL